MTREEKELRIADIRAYMTMEGLPFTQENENNLHMVLDKKTTTDNMIETIIRKYRK